MFKLIQSLFGGKTQPSDTWRVLERMEPLLSFDRLLALKLTAEQQPIVEGLLDGTLDPDHVEGVEQWAERTGEAIDGVAARLYALQETLGSETTTYFFEHGAVAPVGRLPKYEDENTLTIVFNDATNHFQIITPRELLENQNVRNFTIERFDPSKLQAEMKRRSQQFLGVTPKQEQPSKLTLTIERAAGEDGKLERPLEPEALVEALAAEGVQASAESIELDAPIVEHGLYRFRARLNGDQEPVGVKVWVVPTA